jgi:hypothetical protein
MTAHQCNIDHCQALAKIYKLNQRASQRSFDCSVPSSMFDLRSVYYILGFAFAILTLIFAKGYLRFSASYFSSHRVSFNSSFGRVNARLVTTFEFRDPELQVLNGLNRFDQRIPVNITRVETNNIEESSSSDTESSEYF